MASRRPSKAEWEHHREEDAVMAILAQEALDVPGLWDRIKPETRDAMLRRFLELIAIELARRPAHRPKASIGQFVARLVECGASEKRAIALTAKIKKLKPTTVARRHREFKAQRRAAESKP